MCGACGILGGGPDWVERLGDPDAPPPAGRTRLAERQRRIALVNCLLAAGGVRLNEQGSQLIVRSATGRAKMVTDLAHVWAAADLLGRKAVDPLDEAFLTTLQASVGDPA